MQTYGQYCPMSRAAEVFAERWTPIIVRNLMAGCCTYTQISAGAPGLSRTLLTTRLRQLQHKGVVETRPKLEGRGVVYELTAAGWDLLGVLVALGEWGEKWVELGREHSDPLLVLWAWCTMHLARDRLPDRRVVVRFDFPDQPPDKRRLWLLVADGDAELCTKPTRFDEDLLVEMDAMTLARWHLCQIEWAAARRAGWIRIAGPRTLARALPTWNLRHDIEKFRVETQRRRTGNRAESDGPESLERLGDEIAEIPNSLRR